MEWCTKIQLFIPHSHRPSHVYTIHACDSYDCLLVPSIGCGLFAWQTPASSSPCSSDRTTPVRAIKDQLAMATRTTGNQVTDHWSFLHSY